MVGPSVGVGLGMPPSLTFLHGGGSPYVDFLVGPGVIEILLSYDVFCMIV